MKSFANVGLDGLSVAELIRFSASYFREFPNMIPRNSEREARVFVRSAATVIDRLCPGGAVQMNYDKAASLLRNISPALAAASDAYERQDDLARAIMGRALADRCENLTQRTVKAPQYERAAPEIAAR